jgi:hypothetical protein
MKKKTMRASSRIRDERGVALFLALILVSTLSVLTVSMMFLSQSESFASSNYRLMTQSRYGAEAGVQKAADYILTTDFATAAPGLIALIPTTSSPVKWNFQDVVLSSDPAHTSHFPDAAVVAAFQAATTGTMIAGNSTVSFTAYARLLAIDSITDGYTGVSKLVQTWEIVSDATVAGIRRSTVEVSAILDSNKMPTIAFGAFSTDPSCNSLKFVGNVSTNSYTSNGLTGSTLPTLLDEGGDVGTNGNLDIQGHVDVKGNLSSPVQGVGACTNNGGVASTALTESGAASVEGGAPLKLPQTLQLPTPPTPPVSSMHGPGGITDPVSITNPNGSTCGAILPPAQAAANCSVNGNVITLWNTDTTPLTLPNMALGGQTKLVLTASNDPAITNAYNFNAISLNSTNNSLKIESPASTQDVKINISGLDPNGSAIIGDVVNIGGGADVGGYTTTPHNPANTCSGCSQFDASMMQIIYGGTGTMSVAGNPAAALVYYAPNAAVSFSGNSSLFGAIIAKTLEINGGGNSVAINYDQNLAGKGMTASAPMIASFSWKKY